MTNSLTAISLFASGGIGDLALRRASVQTLIANEIVPTRAEIFRRNFPEAHMIDGDIWELKSTIVSSTKQLLNGRSLDMLIATPPCQGMSKNGRGKLLSEIRNNGKPVLDKRNELIIPTVQIIKELQPRVIVFENVPEMEWTVIPDPANSGEVIEILEYVRRELPTEYSGNWEVVEFADYGVPQRRQRLITVFTRDPALKAFYNQTGRLLPRKTHSQKGIGDTLKWVNVKDVIGHLPPLDAKDSETAKDPIIEWHHVTLLDSDKYFWVSNTPPESGAFDNQCANSECGFQGNPIHGSRKTGSGINRANVDTPLYCLKCGEILPRPWVGKGNDRRLMKGFTSAYRRMSWNAPASTLTTNFAYACSDKKIHPTQHRTLSTFEALILHTISNYGYFFEYPSGKKVSKQVLRDIIGESVPPMGMQRIFDFLVAGLRNKIPSDQYREVFQSSLFNEAI